MAIFKPKYLSHLSLKIILVIVGQGGQLQISKVAGSLNYFALPPKRFSLHFIGLCALPQPLLSKGVGPIIFNLIIRVTAKQHIAQLRPSSNSSRAGCGPSFAC